MIKLSIPDWQFIVSTRAAEPDKGDKVTGRKTTVTVTECSGEFDESQLRSAFQGRGLKVAVQTQLRALVNASLESAMGSGASKTAAVELATDEIPREFEMNFKDYLLGNGTVAIDPQRAAEIRYEAFYTSAIDSGLPHEKAMIQADEKFTAWGRGKVKKQQ